MLNNPKRPKVIVGQTQAIDYDEANIDAVKSAWKAERKEPVAPMEYAFTLVQANAPCAVKITKKSRTACVKALLR